jgi:hypothetical protein
MEKLLSLNTFTVTFQINIHSVNDVVNVKMLKGKISRSVGNTSEDSLCKFIVVSCIEG